MSGGARLAIALAAVLLLAARSLAGQAPPIQDNSFLIEEAYNQEAGVVQHINTLLRDRHTGEWGYSFTQEWPLGGVAHQLSFTLPAQGGSAEGRGIGDLALNYRYQLVGDGDAPVAVAPRFSLLLPTGSVKEGRGAGAVGVQINLPVSVVLSRQWVTHWNAGATYHAVGRKRRRRKGRHAQHQPRPELHLATHGDREPDAGDRLGERAGGGRERLDGVRGEPVREPGHSLGAELLQRPADRPRNRAADRRRSQLGGEIPLPVPQLRAPLQAAAAIGRPRFAGRFAIVTSSSSG